MTFNKNDAFWLPDTCQCKIYFSAGFCMQPSKITYIEKCKLHKMINNTNLFNAVVLHNKNFNTSFGLDLLTKEQQNTISQNKIKEKKRISELP